MLDKTRPLFSDCVLKNRGELIEFFETRSVQVILLSEYGITPVNRPIHLNRLFRQESWLR